MSNKNVISIKRTTCKHNQFKVDPTLDTVECGICGEKLNPTWVLMQFAERESRYQRKIQELNDEIDIKTKALNAVGTSINELRGKQEQSSTAALKKFDRKRAGKSFHNGLPDN